MNYWDETMKDDLYMIVENDRTAETYRVIETNEKTKKTKDK
jgi:type I restriction enzyme M protein